jgi:hypothetical protein
VSRCHKDREEEVGGAKVGGEDICAALQRAQMNDNFGANLQQDAERMGENGSK